MKELASLVQQRSLQWAHEMAIKVGWGEGRYIATMMWLLSLDVDEMRQARELLDGGLGLLKDIAYVDYAARFHKILRRSLRLPDDTLALSSVVKFLYLHTLACRGDFGYKKTFEQELEDRRNYQTNKRQFEGGGWSFAAFERYRESRLRELIHQARTTVVKTETEHDVSSLWDSAGGSAGASLNVEDLPLPDALKAKFAGLEVAGTKKIKHMLYRMTVSGGEKVISRTFGKDEPGIPHRRLYPVDILSSDVFSYVERTVRGMLKHSRYTQVNKGQHHMLRQRWLISSLCAAKKVWLNADADSWESQHSARDMRTVVESTYSLLDNLTDASMINSLRKAVYNAVRLHMNQRVFDGENYSDEISSLLSGDDLTQLINTIMMQISIESGIYSAAEIVRGAIVAWILGKGDDSGAAVNTVVQGLLIHKVLTESGLILSTSKTAVEVGMAEFEKSIVDESGWRHPITRRLGSFVFGEPQGSQMRDELETVALVFDFRTELLRRGYDEIAANAITEASLRTHRLADAMAGWRTADWARQPKSVGGLGLLVLDNSQEVERYTLQSVPSRVKAIASVLPLEEGVMRDKFYDTAQYVKELNGRLGLNEAVSIVDQEYAKIIGASIEPRGLWGFYKGLQENLARWRVNLLSTRSSTTV